MAQEGTGPNPETQYCQQCGTHMEQGANFCPSCGTAQAVTAATPSYDLAVGQQAAPEYMGFWIRFAAVLLDYVIIWAAALLLSSLVGWGAIFAVYVINYGYFIILTAARGQTLRKMALDLQVVDAGGNVPSLGRVLLREIIGKFLSGLVVYLGFAWVGWDPQKRAWHDHVSGTYVVRKERERVL